MTHQAGHHTGPPSVSGRRIVIFRILAALLGLFFTVAGLSNARAAWMIVTGTSGDLHPDLNRWFTTVAGTADLIVAGCFLALAWRPKQPLLLFYIVVAAVVAAAINLPFAPAFGILLVIVLVPVVAYPYWPEVRNARTWWQRPQLVLLGVGGLATAVAVVTAVIAIGRQIGGTDPAAQANWWADYAEHFINPALAILIASTRQPGWRLLAGLAAGVWIYLGLVAAFVLVDDTGSWGRIGGIAATAAGVVTAAACLQADADGRTLVHRHAKPTAT